MAEPWSEHHHGFDFMPDEEFAKCKCGIKRKNPYYDNQPYIYNRAPIGTSTGRHLHVTKKKRNWKPIVGLIWLSLVLLSILSLITWGVIDWIQSTPAEDIFSLLRLAGLIFGVLGVFILTIKATDWVITDGEKN